MTGPRIETYRDLTPQLHPTAWLHDSVVVIGDVHMAAGTSAWPGVILRGDQGAIVVGEGSNLQDGTIAHATGGLSTTRVGARCTVGHRVLLHGCTVEDDCLIGMGAILLDNCVIGQGSIIGAGALVPKGRVIPPRSLVLGIPGKIVRTLTDAEFVEHIQHGYLEYQRLAEEYRL
jgi:carbonic anhydrase/acetyltransferase-like protein (isoleucine patch superfamily)